MVDRWLNKLTLRWSSLGYHVFSEGQLPKIVDSALLLAQLAELLI